MGEQARTDAEWTVAWVAGRDAPCPVCGYNLRGLKAARCPECGADLHLTVASRRLNLGPWFLAVVSFALALGFDGVVSALMTAAMITLGGTPKKQLAPYLLLGTLILLAAACAAGLWWMFRRRKGWALWSETAQWRAAAAVFLAVGGVHAALGGWLWWKWR